MAADPTNITLQQEIEFIEEVCDEGHDPAHGEVKQNIRENNTIIYLTDSRLHQYFGRRSTPLPQLSCPQENISLSLIKILASLSFSFVWLMVLGKVCPLVYISRPKVLRNFCTVPYLFGDTLQQV